MLTILTMLGLAGIGMQELLAILLIAVLVFGAARIPEIARSLGKAIREFKKGTREDDDSADGEKKEPPTGKTPDAKG